MLSPSQDSRGDDRVTLMSSDLLASPDDFNPLPSDSAELPPPPPAGPWTWALVSLPVILHFLLSVSLTATMWIYVNHHLFNIHHRRAQYTEVDGAQTTLPHATPLQTDVTTVLSIILSIIRSLGGAWFAGVCWRCAFILLEKDGMRLKDFNNMLSTNFPIMFVFRSPRKNSHAYIKLYTAIVLLLALPAQYAAPILSGSITWVPAFDMAVGNVLVSGIPTTEYGPGNNSWTRYNRYSNNLDTCRTRAAALASIAWSTTDSSNAATGVMKRIVPSARNLVVNSTLANITLPFFTVHSLAWLSDDDLKAIPDSYLEDAISPIGGLTNVSSINNPLDIVAPTLGIIPTEPYTGPLWDPAINDYQFPSPSKAVAQTGLLAVFGYRQDNTSHCTESSDAFGVLPSNVGFRSVVWLVGDGRTNTTDCYIFAHVIYSAGVVACLNCSVSASGGVFERTISDLAPSLADSSPFNGSSFLTELQPDAMTQQTIRMMPEVIATMANMNVSLPPTWDNIDIYAREMLARSYAASWNVLTDIVSSSFLTSWSETAIPPSENSKAPESGGPTGATTQVTIAIPAIRAVVSLSRVMIWCGIQALLSLSGLLFSILQATTNKPLVRKPAAEVFLFDTGEVRRRMGLEGDGGDEQGDGQDSESTGKVTGTVTMKTIEKFEDKDKSFMRLTKEDGYSVIRYEQ